MFDSKMNRIINIKDHGMAVGQKSGHKLLLFYCSFTCIYLPSILLLLKYNDNLYNIGSFKFIPILLILMFAEVVKLSFSMLESNPTTNNKVEVRSTSKTRKSWTKSFKEAFKFSSTLILLSIIYYAVIVLFGAPIFDDKEETMVLTLTLSSLTFIPACLHLGIDSAISILMGVSSQKGNIIMDAVKTNVKATLLGTWLGAVVIPLDWDRPWQVWPIPCVIGALVGYTFAHFITLVQTLSALKISKKLHR